MDWNSVNIRWRAVNQFIKEEKTFLGILLLYVFVLFIFQLLRIYSGISGAWDLGIFVQALTNTLKGHLFQYTVEPWWCWNFSCSFLGVHFCLDLLLILPLFALHPSPVTLVAIKLFVLHFLSLVVLYLYLRRFLDRSVAKLLVLLYAMHPGIIGAALFDFHCEDFFPLFFFAMLYFLEKRNFAGFLISELLVIFALEHFALYLGLFMFFYVLFSKNFSKIEFKKRFLIALLYLLGGYLIFKALLSIMSAFRSPITKSFFLTSDIHKLSLANLTQDAWLKLSYFIELFAPMLFLPLLEYRIVFPVFLWLGFGYLYNIQTYYMIDTQYSYVIIPILLLGFVEAIRFDKRSFPRKLFASKRTFLASLILGLAISGGLASIVILNNVPIVQNPFSRILIVQEVLSLINATPSQPLLLSDNFFVFYSTRNNSYAIIPVIMEPNGSVMRQIKLCWTRKLLKDKLYSYIVIDTSRLERDVRLTVFRNLNYSRYGLYALLDRIFIYKLNYSGEPVIFDPIRYSYILVYATKRCIRAYDYCVIPLATKGACSVNFSNIELFRGTYVVLMHLGENFTRTAVPGEVRFLDPRTNQTLYSAPLLCKASVCLAIVPVREYYYGANFCLVLRSPLAARDLLIEYASPRIISISRGRA